MAPHAGLFGKLPAHGDFVARGLEAGARQSWDAFLSAGLAQSEAELGDRFEAAHETAPTWRFVGPPADGAAGWSAGAVAPSIDRAGRRFALLTVIQDLPADAALLDTAAEAMEAAIFDAFERGLDADALAALIEDAKAALPRSDRPAQAPTPRWWTLGGFDHAPDEIVTDRLDPVLIVRAWAPTPARVQA